MPDLLQVFEQISGKKVLSTLVEAVLVSTAKRVGTWTIDTALDAVDGLAAPQRSALKHFFDMERGFLTKLLRILPKRKRPKILFAGPSGAGKTEIISALALRRTQRAVPTDSIDPYWVLFSNSEALCLDTPGLGAHNLQVRQLIAEESPKILVIVLANGFLDTRNTGTTLKREGGPRFPTRKSYLEHARNEELQWLQWFSQGVTKPKRPVDHVVVVINKIDHWIPDHSSVTGHYQQKVFQKVFDQIVQNAAGAGHKVQFAYAAAKYDSFKGKPPHGTMSVEICRETIRSLRAHLAALLTDGRF